MKFKLKSFVVDLFKSSQSTCPEDIIEQIDRSWSGKARNGPVHYRPPSRDISHRPTRNEHSAHLPVGRAGPGMARVNSEPCGICSMGHTGERGSKQDSASSVHDAQMFSAPMDIYPGSSNRPAAPAPPRQRAQQRRRQKAPVEAAAAATASSEALSICSECSEAQCVHVRTPVPRKSCLKQGGLSTALSREPSVRQGVRRGSASSRTHNCSNGTNSMGPGDKEFGTAADAAIHGVVGSFERRKVRFGEGRNDSARREDTTTIGVPAAEVAAALADLADNQVYADSGSNAGNSTGVIVADTSLALDWPEAEKEAAAVGEGGGKREREREEALTSFLAASSAPAAVFAVPTAAATAAAAITATTAGSVGNAPTATTTSASAVSTLLSSRRRGVASVDEESSPATGDDEEGEREGSAEWNTRFIKRWRAVKHRARLQALGVRSLWKLSSPVTGGAHLHPPELLTNELPDAVDNGLSPGQRAYSLAISMGASVRGGARRSSGGGAAGGARQKGMDRDPSLATMLLGEVAEVC